MSKRCKEALVLGWPGDDLLSRALRHSTISAEAFNGRVRDGIGFGRLAPVTGPAKDNARAQQSVPAKAGASDVRGGKQKWSSVMVYADMDHKSDQADRAISTGQLNASPRLHTRPINVVVFHGSQGSSRFEVGFPLRCLQRLSRPHVANLQCPWQDNRYTSGAFVPVLSY